MTRRLTCLVAAFSSLSLALFAQDAKPRKSPHETVSLTLDGKEIAVSYGRPSLRGRKAVGGSLVPYGSVWRLGADEATKLTTPVDLTIGELKVPAGSYSLFTIATATGWTLIVNKTAEQWGAFSYDKSMDLGRTPMTVKAADGTVEQFTIKFDKSGEKAATLTLSWENTVAQVPVKAL